MKRSHPRRRRRLVPSVTPLEARRLLAAVAPSLAQDGQDLVGPDASPGPDGIEDLHLPIADLTAPGTSIAMPAPGVFAGASQPAPTGAAMAEDFGSSTPA